MDPIRISLRAAGENGDGVMIEISGVDNILTEVPKLYDYLVLFKQRQPSPDDDVPVSIKPVGPVRWEHVVDAFNQAIRAKYKTIGFTLPSG